MFHNAYPVFETKRLLKKEMLDNLRDYPKNLFSIRHRDYSDGILSGCELKEADGGLRIMPGMLYYRTAVYFLEEPCMVACSADGRSAYLKVRFLDKTIGAGQEEYLSRVYVDGQPPDAVCEMELGRFKLQSGARLRTEYVDFYDYDTEFDTVNIIHAPHASPGHGSVSPQILKCFAGEMMRFPIQNPWDCAFCLDCLQLKEAMPYEAVRAYLNVRLNQDMDYTNMQIYSGLKAILMEMGGRKVSFGQPQKKDKTLLMI